MKIECEFDLCIYNEGYVCILDNVKIGVCGNCENVITPVIPEDVLERCKKNLLRVHYEIEAIKR